MSGKPLGGNRARAPWFVMDRRVLGVLIGLGVLGLLVAGVLFAITPIIKMSGPNAFASIEGSYVDLDRVNRDADTRAEYDWLKSWIVNNEPWLRSTLGVTQAVGIAFSLLVSVCCFALALHLRRGRHLGST